MACRLAGVKPLSEPILEYSQLNFKNKHQWNLNQNSCIFIPENAFENVVWKMAAIVSRPQCVIQAIKHKHGESMLTLEVTCCFSVFGWRECHTCIRDRHVKDQYQNPGHHKSTTLSATVRVNNIAVWDSQYCLAHRSLPHTEFRLQLGYN